MKKFMLYSLLLLISSSTTGAKKQKDLQTIVEVIFSQSVAYKVLLGIVIFLFLWLCVTVL